MVSSSQIRAQLARFLNRDMDLDAFEDWFIQNTWNIHQSGSVASESLTFDIQESLSEFSSNHLAEDELRKELSGILHAGNKNVEIMENALQTVWCFKGSPTPPILVSAKV